MPRLTLNALAILLLVPTATAQQARLASPTESKPLRQAVYDAANATSTSAEFADALVRTVASTLNEEAKLIASDATGGDFFGVSVSLSGDRALVGSYLDGTAAGSQAGSAYVFVRSGSVWTEEAKLTASDGAAFDNFGISVSLDGERALIGAEGDATTAGDNAGSAYVFVRSGSTWTEEDKLTASDAAENDFLGSAVSLDGDRAIVGATQVDTDAGVQVGSAYVFVRSSGSWVEEAKLTASDGDETDIFGSAVSLDGDRALVGALLDETAPGAGNGSAYIFVRSGSTWTEEAKLTASDANDNGSGSSFDFGYSVSLDGDYALIGARGNNAGSANSVGAAYVFVRSGSAWTEESKLTASDAVEGDQLGSSVSLEGNRALVGAPGADTAGGDQAGAAYVFMRSENSWTEEAKIIASDSSGPSLFGNSVSLDGERSLVGAVNDAGSTGAAYVFAGLPVATEVGAAAQRLQLDTPFPNPAQGEATVRYVLDETAEVHLALYDLLGREMTVLASGPQSAGPHEAQLSSGHLPAGLYVLRLTAGQEQVTQKVLIVK